MTKCLAHPAFSSSSLSSSQSVPNYFQMIFDYLISINVNLEECEKIFIDNIDLLGDYYNESHSTESEKLKIMDRVHDHFMSKAVKKGLKRVFVIKEVSFCL